VTPYLSRLRPADRGPRLHPRPRSSLEPAPVLPIDRPPIARPSPGVPPAPDVAGVEVELEQATAYPHPAGSALAATTAGEPEPQPVRAAAPGLDPRDEEHPPGRAATTAEAPMQRPGSAGVPPRNSEQAEPQSSHENFSPTLGEGAAGGKHAPTPPGAMSHPVPKRSGLLNPPPDSGDTASPRAEPAPAQQAAVQAPPPASRQVLPPALQQVPLPAPVHGPPPAPHRHVDRSSPQAQAAQLLARAPAETEPLAESKPQPEAELPADRVVAMARWLRHADADSARPEGTNMASAGPALAPPPVRVSPQPAVHTEVTVTIGRIEVKAPAADPVPGQSQSSGPRRRPASLDDYLAARVRARGRAR